MNRIEKALAGKQVEAGKYEAITIAFPSTPKGSTKLIRLDQEFIETDDYMGLASFWNVEYKHYLRDIPPITRKKVHDALRKKKLPVNEESAEHEQIIKSLT